MLLWLRFLPRPSSTHGLPRHGWMDLVNFHGFNYHPHAIKSQNYISKPTFFFWNQPPQMRLFIGFLTKCCIEACNSHLWPQDSVTHEVLLLLVQKQFYILTSLFFFGGGGLRIFIIVALVQAVLLLYFWYSLHFHSSLLLPIYLDQS